MTDRERLIELIVQSTQKCDSTDCNRCKYWNTNDCSAARMADYLLKNSVIVPPCKVGDTVYWIDNEKVKQGEVFEISIHSDGILVHTDIQFCLEVENVFHTREEAEKALNERGEENV